MNVAERARSPPASSGVCGRVTEGQRECPHSRKPALSFLWAAGMSSASLGEQRPWAPCGDLPVWPHGPSPSQLGAAPVEDTPQPASLPLAVALGVRTLQGLSHLQPRRQRVLTEGRGQPRASASPATPAAAPSARPRQHRHAALQAAARLSGGPTPARPISAPVRNQSPQLRGGTPHPGSGPHFSCAVLPQQCAVTGGQRGGRGARTDTHACTRTQCMHMHTRTCAHARKTHAHTCTHMYIRMHTQCMRTHTRARAHMCTHACICIHTETGTGKHMHTHAHMHARHMHTCAHIHTNTRACTCMHTHACTNALTHAHAHTPHTHIHTSLSLGSPLPGKRGRFLCTWGSGIPVTLVLKGRGGGAGGSRGSADPV